MEIETLVEINRTELSFRQWLRMGWSFFWRGLIIMLLSAITSGFIGGLFGFIIGFSCGMAKYPFDNIKLIVQIIAVLIGIVIGFLFLIIQLKWVLKVKYKGFRLAIVKNDSL